MHKFIQWICLFGLATSVLATSPEKITVMLDWFPNPNHAPLFVALQQGYFAKQNLAVNFLTPPDPTDPPKLVAVGKVDIAITYQPQFLEQQKMGLPVAYLGVLINRPLTCLAVLTDSHIRRLEDLKGKRIGTSFSTLSDLVLRTMLAQHHLTLRDVDIVNVHYDLTKALLTKKVDAVTGIMRNFEVIQLEEMHHPVTVFYPETNGIPTYSELIFIVQKNHQNEAKYARFLTALQMGVAYLKAHPEQAWQDFAKQHPELNNSLNHRSWLMTVSYFADRPQVLDKKSWDAFAKFVQQNTKK